MTNKTGKTEAAAALALIEAAFAERARSTVMTDSKQLSDVEYAEVMSFNGLAWQEVNFEQAQAQADAVFWFAPEAFCYYLPEPRWTLLSAAELDAVAAWVRWFQAVEPDAFHDNSYERALDTLALLKERQAGG